MCTTVAAAVAAAKLVVLVMVWRKKRRRRIGGVEVGEEKLLWRVEEGVIFCTA